MYLLQLAPRLEKQGFKVRINDLNGIEKNMWSFGNCVLYVMYVDRKGFSTAKRIARECRAMNDNCIIMACGSGPSKDVTTFLNDDLFDVVIRGEAENAIKLFIQDTFQGRKTEMKQVYKADVRNLNELPLPSRHLIDIGSYNRKLSDRKAVMVMTTRGSPFRTTWLCSGLKTFGIRRVMNEVMGVVTAYGIKNFYFGDEAFCFDKHRAVDIAKALHENGLSFGFNDVITNVNIELLKKLADLGCKELTLNPYGASSQALVDSMKAKIEEETGVRVILRHDGKYPKK